MDYKNLCEDLRQYSQDLVAYKLGCKFADDVQSAADAIEKLQAGNERLKKQLDAAVSDLKSTLGCCGFCSYFDSSTNLCKSTPNPRDCFKWRGEDGDTNGG